MRQLSCLYNKYHCLSGGRGTRGNKSGPVTIVYPKVCIALLFSYLQIY